MYWYTKYKYIIKYICTSIKQDSNGCNTLINILLLHHRLHNIDYWVNTFTHNDWTITFNILRV